jgi:hypothetical protein
LIHVKLLIFIYLSFTTDVYIHVCIYMCVCACVPSCLYVHLSTALSAQLDHFTLVATTTHRYLYVCLYYFHKNSFPTRYCQGSTCPGTRSLRQLNCIRWCLTFVRRGTERPSCNVLGA